MRPTAPTIRRCSWRPGILSRLSSAWARARWPGGGFWPGEASRRAKRRSLLLHQRVEDRLELVEAELAAIDLAVDDEGRRAVHLDLVGRPLADGDDRVRLLLILEARH